jgi:transposase
MEVMSQYCAGLDVHKKTVISCVLKHGTQETRTFGMMTDDLPPLADWLLACGSTHVTVENTGETRRPWSISWEGPLRRSWCMPSRLKHGGCD